MPARRRLQAPALAPIAVVAALLSGCGSGAGTTTSTAQLTKAQFIAKGDAICREAVQKFGQVHQAPPTTSAAAADLTARLIAITSDEIAQIRALSAPKEARASLDRYLRARDRGLAILKQELEAAKRNDPGGFAVARSRMGTGQVARLRLARAVGFKDCSSPATAPSGP